MIAKGVQGVEMFAVFKGEEQVTRWRTSRANTLGIGRRMATNDKKGEFILRGRVFPKPEEGEGETRRHKDTKGE